MMMMSEQRYCCDRCFDSIGRRSVDAARLWLDLCELAQSSDPTLVWINTEPSPSLRVLEVMGFLVTTETDTQTRIRIKGESSDETGIYFCGGECEGG